MGTILDQAQADLAATQTPPAVPVSMAPPVALQGRILSQAVADLAAAAPPSVTPAASAAPAPTPSYPDLTGPGGMYGEAADPTPFFQAVGHNLVKPLHGLTQMVEHGIASGVHAVAPGTAADTYASNTVAGDDKALSDWENGYQTSVPTTPDTIAGAGVGTGLGLLFGGAGKLGQIGDAVAGRVAPLLSNTPAVVQKVGQFLASMGTQGAVYGASQPVTNPVAPTAPSLSSVVTGDASAPSYWGQKGQQAAIGAATNIALPAAANAAGGVLSGLKGAVAPLVTPSSVLGDFLAKMGADGSVGAAPELVPGSQPTTAQVAGSPALVQAEKALATSNPSFKTAMADRETANNAARWEAVNNLAGTPDDLQAAIDARSAATAPMYAAATSQSIPLTADLQGILNKVPDSVLNKASSLAELNGQSSSLIPQVAKFRNVTAPGAVVPGQPAVPSGAAPAQAATPTVTLPPVSRTVQVSGPSTTGYGAGPSRAAPPMVSGQDLHYLKLAMDDATDYSQQATQGGLSSTEQAGVKNLQGQLVDHMDANLPGYADARQTYGQMSVPINDMQVGQAIQGATENKAAAADGTPILTLSGFNSALNKGLKGQEFGVSPEAQATLTGLQQDLQRATISNSVRSSGSDTAANLQAPNWLASQLYGQNFNGKSPLAGTVGAGVGGTLGWLAGHDMKSAGESALAGAYVANKLAAAGANRVNPLLVNALMNPDAAAALVSKAPSVAPDMMQMGKLLLQGAQPTLSYDAAGAGQ